MAKLLVFIVGIASITLFLILILPNEAAKAAVYTPETPEGASFDTSFLPAS